MIIQLPVDLEIALFSFQLGQTGLLNFGMATNLGEGKLNSNLLNSV